MDVDGTGAVVVGAGIAGVACANELVRAGIPVDIRERARVAGGRLASSSATWWTSTPPAV